MRGSCLMRVSLLGELALAHLALRCPWRQAHARAPEPLTAGATCWALFVAAVTWALGEWEDEQQRAGQCSQRQQQAAGVGGRALAAAANAAGGAAGAAAAGDVDTQDADQQQQEEQQEPPHKRKPGRPPKQPAPPSAKLPLPQQQQQQQQQQLLNTLLPHAPSWEQHATRLAVRVALSLARNGQLGALGRVYSTPLVLRAGALVGEPVAYHAVKARSPHPSGTPLLAGVVAPGGLVSCECGACRAQGAPSMGLSAWEAHACSAARRPAQHVFLTRYGLSLKELAERVSGFSMAEGTQHLDQCCVCGCARRGQRTSSAGAQQLAASAVVPRCAGPAM
jgi:hypothetical protein